MKKICSFFLLILALTAKAQTFNYDFTSGYDGWTGDFSDYPATDSVFYELAFTRTTLPAPLNTNKYALKIKGNNHSDDLFMFIRRKMTGLLPNTTYQLNISVEMASDAPTNAAGVGGAPGEGLTIKAGATVYEPLKINNSGNYLMNLNKSNQALPGADMDTIGNIGVCDTTTVYTLISRSNASHLFNITSNANGEVWVCIGTDSGYEGLTILYYNKISLIFSQALGLETFQKDRQAWIFPNPSAGNITVSAGTGLTGTSFTITDVSGKKIMYGILPAETSSIDLNALKPGIYFLSIGKKEPQTFRVIKN